MKGSNELRLNQATMIEAIQYWIDAQLTAKQKVASVKHNSNAYSDEFIVTLETPEATNG